MKLVWRDRKLDFKVGEKAWRIGRGPANDIVIPDQLVSSNHAVITMEGYLLDRGSTNGTFINEKRIEYNVETLLQDGDIVVFGDTKIYVEAEEHDHENGAAASSDEEDDQKDAEIDDADTEAVNGLGSTAPKGLKKRAAAAAAAEEAGEEDQNTDPLAWHPGRAYPTLQRGFVPNLDKDELQKENAQLKRQLETMNAKYLQVTNKYAPNQLRRQQKVEEDMRKEKEKQLQQQILDLKFQLYYGEDKGQMDLKKAKQDLIVAQTEVAELKALCAQQAAEITQLKQAAIYAQEAFSRQLSEKREREVEEGHKQKYLQLAQSLASDKHDVIVKSVNEVQQQIAELTLAVKQALSVPTHERAFSAAHPPRLEASPEHSRSFSEMPPSSSSSSSTSTSSSPFHAPSSSPMRSAPGAATGQQQQGAGGEEWYPDSVFAPRSGSASGGSATKFGSLRRHQRTPSLQKCAVDGCNNSRSGVGKVYAYCVQHTQKYVAPDANTAPASPASKPTSSRSTDPLVSMQLREPVMEMDGGLHSTKNGSDKHGDNHGAGASSNSNVSSPGGAPHDDGTSSSSHHVKSPSMISTASSAAMSDASSPSSKKKKKKKKKH